MRKSRGNVRLGKWHSPALAGSTASWPNRIPDPLLPPLCSTSEKVPLACHARLQEGRVASHHKHCDIHPARARWRDPLDSPNEDGTSAAYEKWRIPPRKSTPNDQTTVFDSDEKDDTAKSVPSSYPGCFMTFLTSSRIPIKLARG
jgi:hypothetical protein